MTLQLAMDMAGTFPLLGYLLIKRIFKKQVSAQRYVYMLRLAIILYLCPFQQFKYLVLPTSVLKRWNLNDFWGIIGKKVGGFEVVNIPSLSGDYYVLEKRFFILCILWLIICTGLVLYYYGTYFFIKRRIRRNGIKTELFFRKSGKTVEVFQSSMVRTPCTVGWIRPEIFIPEKDYTTDEKEWLLRHELTHIRHGDVFWKCAVMLCIAYHWYNPFVYYLFHQYSVMCEYYCDAECMRNRDMEEKKSYAVFLVRSAAVAKPRRHLAIVQGLTDNGERMQERVDRIITEDSRTVWKIRLIILGILTVMCTCSFMTVFVYSATQEQNIPAEDNEFTEKEWEYFYGEDVSSNDKNLDFSESPLIFQSKEGEVTPVLQSALMNSSSNKQKIKSQALCSHIMEEGTLKIHARESAGAGCHIKAYKAQKCKKCNMVKQLEMSYTSDYAECPHSVKY